MQKHRTYKRSDSQRWRNANSRLTESVSKSIVNVLTDVVWGDEFSVSYLKSEYLSKYCDEGLTPALQRRANAIAKWESTEETNRHTNVRLAERDPGYNILPRVSYSAFLKFARRIIHSVLGPLQDEILLGSFSGGASTSRRRTESHPAFKFSDKADATEAAGIYVESLYRQAPLLRQYGIFGSLHEVEGAVLFTVPKKTDIDRCACKEPDFNMFLQKGVGRHIRSRLRRHGIDLNDQSVNRKLAHQGSLDGTLATLDLSSASDTITIEAVRALLPNEWFLYLDSIRSPIVTVDGRNHRTEMFSSMGNGFTFELESLLFYSLVRAATYFEGVPGVISIYGDDIICPSGAYDAVSWVLKEFGFSINAQKSFSSGPFRESCGGHYHEGSDVTPFYLKRKPVVLTDLIRVCNQIRLWATSDWARRYELPSIYNVWINLAEHVPRDLWGGYDLSVDTQLASPDIPSKRLVRMVEDKKVPQTGSYLFWHNSNWKRSSDPKELGYEPQSTENRCRMRGAANGERRCEALFQQEEG